MGLFRKLFGSSSDAPAEEASADIKTALALYKKGAYGEAFAMAEKLVAAGPGVGLSWRFRGECLFSLGRYDEAVASFDKASGLGGRGTEDVFLWSALALHNGGQTEQAKTRLRDVLRRTDLTPELRARTEEGLRKLEGG